MEKEKHEQSWEQVNFALMVAKASEGRPESTQPRDRKREAAGLGLARAPASVGRPMSTQSRSAAPTPARPPHAGAVRTRADAPRATGHDR